MTSASDEVLISPRASRLSAGGLAEPLFLVIFFKGQNQKANLSLNLSPIVIIISSCQPMSEETTKHIDGGRSFEERVFARFDAQDALLQDLNARLQKLEARAYDTKPIWEQALKEIMETRREL